MLVMPEEPSEGSGEEIYTQEADRGVVFKLIFVGDPAVGKTSLIRKYVTHQFEHDYLPTVGVSISKQPVEVDGRTINLLIWDLAGMPQFYMLHKVYFNGANGVIFVYDSTRPHTYTNTKNWYEDVTNNGLRDVPMILVGNKSDLAHQRRIIPPQADHMCEQLGIEQFFTTSALTGDGVQKMFQAIAEKMYARRNPDEPAPEQ
jgi:small GTP-binding protein